MNPLIIYLRALLLNYILVMPRFVDKVGEWYQFPLSIPYASSCMKTAGLRVYTVNMNHEEGSVAETVQAYLKKYNIGMVLYHQYIGSDSTH